MMKKTHIIFISLSLLTSIAPVMAQDTNPLTFSAGVGVEHESNISVEAADITTVKGDSAFTVDASIAYDFLNHGDRNFTVGYDYSKNFHFDLKEFDLQIHGGNVKYSQMVSGVNLSASYRFNSIKLGTADFLKMHIFEPSFMKIFQNKIILMGSYQYMKQDFQQLIYAGRNAERHSGKIKAIYLLGGGKNISLGYKIIDHTTELLELIYTGHQMTAGFKVTLGSLEDVILRGSYRFTKKNYKNIHPDLLVKRDDKNHVVNVSLEKPIYGNIHAKLKYEYSDSMSNITVLNYNNHVISFGLTWEL